MMDETRNSETFGGDSPGRPGRDEPGEAGRFDESQTGAPANDEAAIEAEREDPAELKDRLLRTLADMENLRRRATRDVEEARKYAVTGFARGLLEVSDNLTRALQSVPPDAVEQDQFLKNLVQGVGITERALQALLEKHEVRRVMPQRGERFDHKLHQAMFEVSAGDLPAGTVTEVLQPGYVIADRLLRPAMVGVAKAPTAGPSLNRVV